MHLWRRLGIVQASLASALALHKRSNYKPLTGQSYSIVLPQGQAPVLYY